MPSEPSQNDISAVASSMGYGYTVKAVINGNDIGMKGGLSESKRLFATDDPMKSEAPPEMQKQLFVLHPGANTVHLEFKKVSQEPDQFTFEISLLGQENPVVSYKTTDPSGVFDAVLNV